MEITTFSKSWNDWLHNKNFISGGLYDRPWKVL